MTYQEWVLDVGEDRVLRDHVIHLSQLDDIGLLQSLHGKVLSCALLLREHHATERPYTGIERQICVEKNGSLNIQTPSVEYLPVPRVVVRS